MANNGRLTQRDIARLAGVSQATVSLVLNDAKAAAGRIPDETRERVQKVIRETGYVADPVARRMAKGLNRILGVFTYEPAFPSEQADFYAPFLLGIEEMAEALGYDLLLMTATGRGEDGRKRIFGEDNRLRLADGCLILGGKFDAEELARLVAGDYPYVAVGRRDDAGGPVRYVGADYVPATAALVERALDLGHQNFAFIGSTDVSESIRDRWAGFQSALHPRGRLVHLESNPKPDAADQLAAVRACGATVVFFGDLADATAFEAAASAAGLRVPDDISIVVIAPRARNAQPGRQYTSYTIPREEMARQATAMLVETITDPMPVRQVLLDCELAFGDTLTSPRSKKEKKK